MSGNNKESPAAKESSLWRLEPEKSFADWKIEVVCSSAPRKVDTYHVHKAMLGAGPRKSVYFERLFCSGPFQESLMEGVTRISLEESACHAFPYFLDYIYHYDRLFLDKIINDSLYPDALKFLKDFFPNELKVAVLHLADYFNVKNLHDELRRSMGFSDPPKVEWDDSTPLFYKEALVYNDASVKQTCLKRFSNIPTNTLLAILDGKDDATLVRKGGTTAMKEMINSLPENERYQIVVDALRRDATISRKRRKICDDSRPARIVHSRRARLGLFAVPDPSEHTLSGYTMVYPYIIR